MKNITIAEGITATLTNRTYNAMCDYKARYEQLSQWEDSAYADHDWGEYMHYGEELRKLDDEYSWLWG